jgi:hypothetical protein
MPYQLVITVALSTAICVAPVLTNAASAGEFRRDGYRSRTTPEAVRRSLLPGHRLGSSYLGANPAPHFGSRPSSGWYQRGFGGTLNPGWGYNFGPNLGGLGR